MKDRKKYTILDSKTPVSITSSTDATPIVVTATSHGFSSGDKVMIYGHATNVAANGLYKVTVLTSSTFSLQDINSGSSVAGSGAGAGSGGLVVAAPAVVSVEEHDTIILQVDTASSANMTFLAVGSVGVPVQYASSKDGDTPNFGATQSKSNSWTALSLVDTNDGSTVSGTTGIAASGTDIHKQFEINVNSVKYFTVIPSAWSAGSITIVAFVTS